MNLEDSVKGNYWNSQSGGDVTETSVSMNLEDSVKETTETVNLSQNVSNKELEAVLQMEAVS